MKSYRVLFVVIMVGVCCVAEVMVSSHLARADNEVKPAAPALPGRFQQLTPTKDAAPDEVHILDTATGRLYSLQRRAKPKDKEPTYEWVLIADGPK